MKRTKHQRGNESGVLFFDGAAKQIFYRSWLGNSKSYDWLTTELRKLRLTYDWVTIFHLDPSKNAKKLRLTYDFPFGPFRKLKKVTIDLRFFIWALQKTQKKYGWLTIELRLTYKVIILTYESYKWLTRNFYNFYKSEI